VSCGVFVRVTGFVGTGVTGVDNGAGDDGCEAILGLVPAVCQGDFEMDALSAGFEKKSLVCRLAFLRSF